MKIIERQEGIKVLSSDVLARKGIKNDHFKANSEEIPNSDSAFNLEPIETEECLQAGKLAKVTLEP